MLRIRPDIATCSVGFEPLSPRAIRWVEGVIVDLGGVWRTVDYTSCYWLTTDEIPTDLFGSSELELLFGPPLPSMALLRQLLLN